MIVEKMPPGDIGAVFRRLYPIRITFAAFFLLLLAAIAIAGGLLNRARGGMHPFTHDSYWSAHIRSRLLMAGPTGALVLLMAFHIRASLIIFIMTWFSLYTGWGAYFNIGNSPTAYLSRSGVFDWALGRSEINWTYHHNFMREYTGMSLRGLLWTGPAGYALNMLGLGWHYSLAGSWMGLVYYLGGKTPHWDTDYAERNLDGQIAWSELYWGWWIWFILELTCIAYLIQAVRKRLKIGSSCNEAFSLLCVLWSGCYEMLMFIINIIFASSVGFYQLVEQEDTKNKGQTFFGLFTGVLFLTFMQAFNWGSWWNSYQVRRQKRKLARSTSVATINGSSENHTPNETTPLLPWPQNHPNANHLQQSETSADTAAPEERQQNGCIHLWNSLEMVIHLDSFIILRWFFGLLSTLHTVLVLLMFTLCIVMDINSPRFISDHRINVTDYDYDYVY